MKRSKATFTKATDDLLKQEYDPSKETKFIKVIDNNMPVDYGIKLNLVPKVTNIIVLSPEGEDITKAYLPM